MRDMEEIFHKVTQYAMQVPEPSVQEHLRNAAITLCKRTRCWRMQDSFEVTGDMDDVVCVPSYASLFEIEEARFNDIRLERSKIEGDMIMADLGQPRYVTQFGPNAVALQPRGQGTLWVSMFVMPSLQADVLPDFMIDQFADALGHGALSTLLLIPDQPFSDPQRAAYFDQQFTQALDRNFAYNVRGQQRAPIRTRARFL
jgi:hypothetical protein